MPQRWKVPTIFVSEEALAQVQRSTPLVAWAICLHLMGTAETARNCVQWELNGDKLLLNTKNIAQDSPFAKHASQTSC